MTTDYTQMLETKQNIDGFAVSAEIMFSNHKNVYKKSIEKRQTKLMKNISFIAPFLVEDEQILLVTTGCSPVSFLEQMTTGWIVFYLKRSLFVFTNMRIFHIPTKTNYSYRDSIAQILYDDCLKIDQKGRSLVVKFKSGKKEKFIYIARKERKKIKALMKNIPLNDSQRELPQRTHLCPQCTNPLIKNEYICPHCELEFKNKTEARRFSILYPGGGYFYTRHPWLGISDAIAEFSLTCFVIYSILDVFEGDEGAMADVIFFSIILILEKLVTIYHSNHFIKEYIPDEKEITTISTPTAFE